MARIRHLNFCRCAQRQYWERQLAGAPLLLELPTDKARPAQPSGRGSSVPVLLPAEVTAALRDLAAKSGVTMFVALTAAWQACPAARVLHRYSTHFKIWLLYKSCHKVWFVVWLFKGRHQPSRISVSLRLTEGKGAGAFVALQPLDGHRGGHAARESDASRARGPDWLLC